nr:reverse transcriptase domain-containing protein [Tanacetum cinerariifolium]
MFKEHDQQAKMKATPRKLAYADSDKEAQAVLLAKGFSDRFSLESSSTFDTRRQTRSTIKSQKNPSKNKESTHLRRSRRLEDKSTTKEKARRERSKSRRNKFEHQETSLDSKYKEGSDDACEDLNSPYKRPKPTPFTQRITHFKYHKWEKLPRNIRVYEENKDLEDHLGFSGETYHPLGVIDLRVTLGKEGRSKTVLLKFVIIKCRSPYNIIIGRTRMRSLEAVGSNIYSMIKFPINQGVLIMETSREALQECKHLERVQGLWKEVQWRQLEEQMSMIREQVILRTKSNSRIEPTLDLMSLEQTWGRKNTKEAFTISLEHLH